MPETASYRDIVEQAGSLRLTQAAAESFDLGDVGADRPWLFVGCGASFHAATTAAGLCTALTGRAATAVPASDLWMNPDVWLSPDAVVVGLSRTGTTTETVQSLRVARQSGATTIGLSLTPDTPVVEDVDHGLALNHVGEQGRVMTRSFANLLLATETLVVRAARRSGGRDQRQLEEYSAGLARIPDAVAAAVDDHDTLAGVIAKRASNHVVFLGSGPDIGLCRQGALQTQETARPAVEAHTVLDYRHGPLATLTSETLVVLLSTTRSVPADLILAEDVALLGAPAVVVGTAEVVDRFPETAEKIRTSGGQPLWLNGNLALPFLQLLAYHLTVARDADPESVRNLDRTKTPHVNPHVIAEDLFSPGRQ